MKQNLKFLGYQFEEEYRFDDVRKFRFDIAMPEHKLAVEYDGLMSAKSGHTTIGGFTSDCTKINLAQINGWKVFKYTVLNYKDMIPDVEKIVKKLPLTNNDTF